MDKVEKKDLTIENQIANDLASLWKEYKAVIFGQLAVIEEAERAAADRKLTAELRDKARTEAHKLAGSVGSFGFTQGSVLAAGIENILKSTGEIDGPLALQLSECVARLRQELDKDRIPT